MKTPKETHTTNYFDTFIEVAPDSPVRVAQIPPQKGEEKTIANLQYEMLINQPYQYTSDEVVFNVFATKNKILDKDRDNERKQFFSRGQSCLRCSSLGKKYGWGTHHNNQGKVALLAIESDEYKKLVNDKTVKHIKAMRSKRI